MATSSFDSTIKINKKSANSLIKILEGEIYKNVDLNTSIEVKKRKEGKKMEKEIKNAIAIFEKAVAELLELAEKAVQEQEKKGKEGK